MIHLQNGDKLKEPSSNLLHLEKRANKQQSNERRFQIGILHLDCFSKSERSLIKDAASKKAEFMQFFTSKFCQR